MYDSMTEMRHYEITLENLNTNFEEVAYLKMDYAHPPHCPQHVLEYLRY